MFEQKYSILDNELDAVYQHVHHATTMLFLERARLDFLKVIGFPNELLIERDMFIVIVNLTVEYLRELKKGVIRVSCENPKIRNKAIFLSQRIHDSRDKLAVEARFQLMFMSGSTRRGIKPEQDFVRAFLGLKGSSLRSLT